MKSTLFILLLSCLTGIILAQSSDVPHPSTSRPVDTTVAPTGTPSSVVPTTHVVEKSTVAPTRRVEPSTVKPTMRPTATRTVRPSTAVPSTMAPTTRRPIAVTTEKVQPSTAVPTTAPTHGPTTMKPKPSTAVPTTSGTHGPSTVNPSTAIPTTEAPIMSTTGKVHPSTAVPTTEGTHGPTTERVRPSTVVPTTERTHGPTTLRIRPSTPAPTTGNTHPSTDRISTTVRDVPTTGSPTPRRATTEGSTLPWSTASPTQGPTTKGFTATSQWTTNGHRETSPATPSIVNSCSCVVGNGPFRKYIQSESLFGGFDLGFNSTDTCSALFDVRCEEHCKRQFAIHTLGFDLNSVPLVPFDNKATLANKICALVGTKLSSRATLKAVVNCGVSSDPWAITRARTYTSKTLMKSKQRLSCRFGSAHVRS